jgi:hypothetical protein
MCRSIKKRESDRRVTKEWKDKGRKRSEKLRT